MKARTMRLWLANGLRSLVLVLHCGCNFPAFIRGLPMCGCAFLFVRKALILIVTYLLVYVHTRFYTRTCTHTTTHPFVGSLIHFPPHPKWLLWLTMIYKHGHVINAVKCQYCWSWGISHFSYRFEIHFMHRLEIWLSAYAQLSCAQRSFYLVMWWASSGESAVVWTTFPPIIYIKLHVDNNAVLPILSLYLKFLLCVCVCAPSHESVFELEK